MLTDALKVKIDTLRDAPNIEWHCVDISGKRDRTYYPIRGRMVDEEYEDLLFDPLSAIHYIESGEYLRNAYMKSVMPGLTRDETRTLEKAALGWDDSIYWCPDTREMLEQVTGLVNPRFFNVDLQLNMDEMVAVTVRVPKAGLSSYDRSKLRDPEDFEVYPRQIPKGIWDLTCMSRKKSRIFGYDRRTDGKPLD